MNKNNQQMTIKQFNNAFRALRKGTNGFIDSIIIKKPRKTQHEDILHKACIQWFCMQYGMRDDIFIHHSPNENAKGDKSTMIKYNTKMNSMARMAGFPDLEIGYKGKILYIELKAENGRLSDNQKIAHKKITNAGFDVHVIRSTEEFVKVVKGFII